MRTRHSACTRLLRVMIYRTAMTVLTTKWRGKRVVFLQETFSSLLSEFHITLRQSRHSIRNTIPMSYKIDYETYKWIIELCDRVDQLEEAVKELQNIIIDKEA